MKRVLLVLIASLFFLPNSSFAETLLLSTYYPAPFGIYNQMRLVPSADPTCNATNNGLLWVNAAHILMMCQNDGDAAPPPTVWLQDQASPPNVSLSDVTSSPAPQVGIGTATPDRKLHVTDGNASVMRLDSSAGGEVEILMSESGTTRNSIGASSTQALYVKDNALSKNFIVEQDGDVAIGLATADHALTIKGSNTKGVRIEGASGTGAAHSLALMGNISPHPNMGGAQAARIVGPTGKSISVEINGNNAGDRFSVITDPSNGSTADTEAFIVRNDGNVVISSAPGAGSPPQWGGLSKLSVGDGTLGGGNTWIKGDLLVSTTGLAGGDGNVVAHVFTYVSDEKTKENIKPVRGLDAIMQLRGVEFTYVGTNKKGIGLVAQEVEKVFPELVNEAMGDLKGVQYGNLVAPLIEAIKEQQAQIETLKEEIEILKTRSF